MNIRKLSKTTTTIEYSAVLNKQQILKILNTVNDVPIPGNANIFVKVPEGGEYSGTLLHIGEDVDLEITWQETT